MQRREFLSHGALAAGAALLATRVAFARAATSNTRFVLVIMRGALDGLAAVPPLGDRDYRELRRELALHSPGEPGGALPLDGFFGLHPALAPFKPIYDEGHLAIVHAVGSPDNTRSHFDAQDFMESGTPGTKITEAIM